MKLYDTLSREKKEFIPIREKRVNLFVCGPTVYDYSHLGHARTYIPFDVLAEYLRYRGYLVFYLQNITDIDDKIINRAKKENKKWDEISKMYLKAYLEDMRSLRINSINLYAPASYYIDEIIDQVKRLIEKGFAYETNDGIYFEISKFPDYGKLSHQSLDSIMAGARVEINEMKRHPADFALWKKHKPGEPYWESPWGKGRPGWHIEDTAITEFYFGPQYDIHGGGSDLIFPHHECEIAQMESVSGKKPLVRYWMHTGLLTVREERMGKSMGNAVNIRELLKSYQAETIRFYILSSHYRSPIDFSFDALNESRNSWEKIVISYEKLNKFKVKKGKSTFVERIEEYRKSFEDAMDDDLNTPLAISVIQSFVQFLNKNLEDFGEEDKEHALIFLRDFDSVFKIIPSGRRADDVVELLIKIREIARSKKEFDISDRIREMLREMNIVVEDTKDGQVWYYL